MSTETITVQNVKCGGCASNITQGLEEMDGISSVAVEVESGTVTIEGETVERETIISKLDELGYPAK